MNAPILIAISSGILFLLGFAHLVYTFYGPKLKPREPDLIDKMSRVSPGISSETSMWKCWIGFNASHSLCALFYGLMYGYLSIWHGDFLLKSHFLLVIGFALLASLAILAKTYWFSLPFRGIALALASYCAAMVLNFT